ncbi:MAG: T9SS type A sorting domain-containing protein [Saprospiraceae bacterium]
MQVSNMRRFFLYFGLWCCFSTISTAQISINNGDCNLGIDIPDLNCVLVDIPITNAPSNQLGQTVFLAEVRLILTHSWRNDLAVNLIAPDGITKIRLIDERGGSSDNFGLPAENDCSQPIILTNSACTADSINDVASSTEAIGAFIPEEAFANFHLSTPINPNGTWKLEVCDEKTGDIGVIDYVELVFVPIGCPAPTNLEAFNITATTIDLGWENSGQCNNIVVEYGPEGFTPGNGTIAGDINSQVIVLNCVEEFDLLNLAQLTNYDIYVRQICNTYNFVYNSCKVTTRTDCILPPVTLSENFNNQLSCGADGTCLDCPTISGVWKNAIDDDIDWIVNSSNTITSGTGPTNDADVNGKYIYLESSGTCRPNKTAILSTDCIEINASTGICHLSFFYHMFGTNVNTMFLEITTDGTNWVSLWNETGSQGDEWIRQYINLSAYDGMVVQFRFRGISAAVNFRGDIGLDRIEFYGSRLKASAVFYADTDNDGFGNPNDSIAVCFAAQPIGYVNNALDCDDTNPLIHPDATEIPCNGIDENCNGIADDAVIFNPTFTLNPICSGESTTITVMPSNAGQIYWFEEATGTTLLDSGTVFTTPILTTTTTYYFQEIASFTGQTCESGIIPATITVNPIPSISNASGSQTICQNTSFDLRDLILQDANNATDTLLFFANDSYASSAAINNPIITVSSDSIFYIQAVSSGNCTDELAVSFSVQAAPSVNIAGNDTLALCFQGAPQLINATSGNTGIGPFDLTWSTGAQGTEAIVFARAKDTRQTVSVTITSQNNGCSASDQIIIHTLPSISTIEVTDIQEPGFCQENGAIIIEPRDGPTPYNYAWNGTASGTANNIISTNYTIDNLELGVYNITVTDNFGCSKNLPQQVVNGPNFGIDAITDVTCFDLSDGAINLKVGGLVNPTYQWSDGTTTFSTNQNVAGLSGGIYSVIVDADNVPPCPIDSIVIREPALLAILNQNIGTPSCAGLADASIDLTITGGNPTTNGGYNFAWNNGLPNTSTPQNLTAGTYQVTITDTNNCSVSETIIIDSTPALTLNLNQTAPQCFEEADGEITSAVTGGTAPYNYAWNDGLSQTTPIAYGLAAGVYTLTVTDVNNCAINQLATLSNPPALSAVVATIGSPLCNEISDGTIDLTVTGGTGNYHYLWNTTDTMASLAAISAGNYAVTITDDNNCDFILDSILVTAPELMDITFTNLSNPLCIGVDNGQISTNINGGVAPYNYAWNNEANTASVNNLAAADYFVQVTDANGCIALSDTTTLTAPQLLTIDDFLVIDSIQCKGSENGSVFYNVSSQAPNATSFSFEWLDSANIVNNSNGFWLSSQFTTLSAGHYDLAIQDNIGCRLNTSFDLSEPDFLQIDTVLIEAPSCFGESDGNAIVSLQGGTMPYSYSWTLPNSRIVRTQENVLQEVDGGAYKLEVIDANNCVSPPYTFEVASSSPIQLQVVAVQNASCSNPEGGFINLTTSGGREGINFEWNNGLLTEDLTNLDEGTYSITITDGAECTVSQSFDIILEEDSLNIELIAIDQPNCENTADGEIAIKVNGGFGSYQFFWSNGLQTIDGDSTLLQNLSAGAYDVSVIDASNEYLCVGYLGDLTLISEGNIAVTLDDFNNELACFGDEQGAYFITPTGGNTPYQYAWSNGDTTQDVTNLGVGSYVLTITDANNCAWSSGELFPEILAPSTPFLTTANFVTDSLCVGDDRGQIDLSATGGTSPYKYEWNNGATTANIQNLLPGAYSLTVTDENNCQIQFDTTIAIRVEALDVSLLTADLTCFDDNSGFIEAKVICGVPPYQYAWSTGDTTRNLINLEQGGYSLTVTDANGAIMKSFATLRSPPLLTVDTTRIDLFNCEGFIRLAVSGGVSNSYNYTWRDDMGTIISTESTANGLATGSYSVTVQDANNCRIELTDLIVDNDNMIDSLTTSSIFNRQSNRGTLSVDSVYNGTAPFTYLWFNDTDDIIGTNPIVSGVILGNYYVIVKDKNGCEYRKNQTLDISDPIIESLTVERFNLYPNPTNHTSYLDLHFLKKVDVSITLLNGVGQQIFQIEKTNISAIQEEINLSAYPSGLFYLKITVDNGPAFGEKLFYFKN